MLKDTINKFDKVYKPMGYRFSFGVGKLGGQNSPHFYMRIVPKYKKNYGFIKILLIITKVQNENNFCQIDYEA